MPKEKKIEVILTKLAQGEAVKESEKNIINEAISSEEKISVQLNKYIVNIGKGEGIHIGDRNYYSWNDEALKALINLIQSGDVDEANLLVTKLGNAQLKGQEGDRQTGSFYPYNVWLEDVSLEKSHDATENNLHIQQYTIQGKWSSEVYKEINAFGLRVDRPWGSKKKLWKFQRQS